MKRLILLAAVPALLAAGESAGSLRVAEPTAVHGKGPGPLSAGEEAPGTQAGAATGPVSLTESPSGSVLPPHQLYHILFRLVLGMEEAANQADSQGMPGCELRAHYQEAIGLSGQEALLLRSTAEEAQWLMAREDERTLEFIAWYTARFAGCERLGPEDWQEFWDRGDLLAADRRRIMKNQVQRLQTLLGPEATAKVEAYLRQEVTPCITVTPLAGDEPHA